MMDSRSDKFRKLLETSRRSSEDTVSEDNVSVYSHGNIKKTPSGLVYSRTEANNARSDKVLTQQWKDKLASLESADRPEFTKAKNRPASDPHKIVLIGDILNSKIVEKQFALFGEEIIKVRVESRVTSQTCSDADFVLFLLPVCDVQYGDAIPGHVELYRQMRQDYLSTCAIAVITAPQEWDLYSIEKVRSLTSDHRLRPYIFTVGDEASCKASARRVVGQIQVQRGGQLPPCLPLAPALGASGESETLRECLNPSPDVPGIEDNFGFDSE